MTSAFLPYGRHWIDDDDIAAVADSLRSEWLTTGPAVESFEAAFASAVGARFAVACANGTAALHLAALAAGVGSGDTCIAPTMSFLASANGMRYAGAEIVFADCDEASGLVTPRSFVEALDRAGSKVRMAVVVHLNGQPADMNAIGRIASERGIVLLEDACHALGSRYHRKDGTTVAVGACTDSAMAVFSLHPVKTVTMGEGGVITTNDEQLFRRLRLLRSHGMVREAGAFANEDMAYDATGEANPWYYEMQELGYNFRVPDFACALAQSQLSKLGMFAERRRVIKDAYDRSFEDSGALLKTLPIAADTEPVLHLYPVFIDFAALGKERAQVMRELKSRGIGTQVHYIPVHRQPYYAGRYGQTSLPGADRYYARALSLPYYAMMEAADAERVARDVKDVLGLNA